MGRVTAISAWMRLQVPEHRACDLCDHGVTLDGQRHCTYVVAVQPAQSQPVQLMRAPLGPCGPNAEHLVFKGLYPPGREPARAAA